MQAKRAGRAAAAALVAAFLPACSPETTTQAFTGRKLGTMWSVKIAAGNVPETRRTLVLEMIEAELDLVDKRMSTYRNDSELSLLNRHTAGEPFPVSPETLTVLVASEETGQASGGAFDITVGPLVDAWGFGPQGPTQTPSDGEVEQLRSATGWDKIKVDVQTSTVTRTHAEARLDLSAAAKGYAVDRVSEALSAAGWTNHMVEVGGEVRVSGRNTQGRRWRIGIERPSRGERAVQQVVPLENEAMATSGDYRNYYERGGKFYSHTIDPRTGRPVQHRLASASVVAGDCMHADARATALMALGEDEGYRTAVEAGWAALLLVRTDGGDQVDELATPAFSDLLARGEER